MLRWIYLLIGLTGAILMSQFPAFHQQYLQRLGGHVNELRLSVSSLDERAANADLDRYAYVRRLIDNADPVVSAEGDALMDMVARYIELSASLKRLSSLPGYAVAGAMVIEVDREIGIATMEEFEPSVTLNLLGIGHALVGFFIGYLGSMGILSLVMWRRVPVKPEGELQ